MKGGFEIERVSPAALGEYVTIPSEFEVFRILDIEGENDDPKGFTLTERELEAPYLKNYDDVDGEGPKNWAKRFDLSNWGIFLARMDGEPIGGTVVAMKTSGLDLLEQRLDLAVLWDIRVSPQVRGQGVGTALFNAAEKWSQSAGCRELKIETQNINIPACGFYAKKGCVLKRVNRFAYRNCPSEIQLLWYKNIGMR
jgi:GNAT superfamily N-acetyltransferase